MVQRFRYFAYAEETAWGTKVAATEAVDLLSSTLDAPGDTEIVQEGGLGRGARTRRPGFYAPSGNIVVPVDIRTIARILRWALGGYTFSATGGTVADNLHEIYGTNESQLPFFSGYIGKDAFEHVFTSCTVTQLQIAVSDGLAQATLDVVAQKDEKSTIKDFATVSALLPTGFPHSFVDVTISVAGSDASAKVRDFTLTISNNGDAAAGRGMGSRFPYRVLAGGRDVTWSMGRFFDGTGELEKLWGAATGPDTGGADEFELIVTLDAGTDGKTELKLPRSYYTAVNQQPSGRAEMPQGTQGRSLAGSITLNDGVTSVQSEILATVDSDAADLAA